jgi:hypothetical protein
MEKGASYLPPEPFGNSDNSDTVEFKWKFATSYSDFVCWLLPPNPATLVGLRRVR